MKKILRLILFFFIVIFVIPVLCTRKNIKAVDSDKNSVDNVNNVEMSSDEKNLNNEDSEKEKYNYQDYAEIKLYHKQNDTIEKIDLDEYIYGTVSAEMPASYEQEALKAQAVVSRTYTVYQINNNKGKHKDADICDDYTCCQAWISKEDRMAKWSEENRQSYWDKIVEAVNSTKGKIITYNQKPINAFFHSNSGGITEIVSNVWGGTDLPYLQSVETVGETEYSQYSSEVSFTKNEFIKKMQEEYPNIKINWNGKNNEGNFNAVQIKEFTESGRVKTLQIGNEEIAGTKARSLLGLKSTNFKVKIDSDKIIFSVIGYGHGVGMSQTGADSMAKAGSNYEEIIKHFYSGVELKNL